MIALIFSYILALSSGPMCDPGDHLIYIERSGLNYVTQDGQTMQAFCALNTTRMEWNEKDGFVGVTEEHHRQHTVILIHGAAVTYADVYSHGDDYFVLMYSTRAMTPAGYSAMIAPHPTAGVWWLDAIAWEAWRKSMQDEMLGRD